MLFNAQPYEKFVSSVCEISVSTELVVYLDKARKGKLHVDSVTFPFFQCMKVYFSSSCIGGR